MVKIVKRRKDIGEDEMIWNMECSSEIEDGCCWFVDDGALAHVIQMG